MNRLSLLALTIISSSPLFAMQPVQSPQELTRQLQILVNRCSRGEFNVQEMEKLILAGADPNVRLADGEYTGCTALWFAVKEAGILSDFYQFLLEHNANPNIPDSYGKFPLQIATRDGHYAVVQKLIEYGADVSRGILKPLFIAAAHRRFNIIELFLDNGAGEDIVVPDNEGNTALSGAKRYGGEEAVKLLKVRKIA